MRGFWEKSSRPPLTEADRNMGLRFIFLYSIFLSLCPPGFPRGLRTGGTSWDSAGALLRRADAIEAGGIIRPLRIAKVERIPSEGVGS
jgi:hypothetical protein